MKDQIIRKLLRRSYSVVSSANVPSESSETEINPQAGEFNGFGVKYKTSVTLGLTGLVIIATGMILMFAHPYQLIFDLKILFTDGGEVFELWRNPPVDLYLRVHLFNITNADEFLSGKEKLRVQEVGPYVYKEIMSHDNATFNDNGTISATPRHPLVWVPELSIGDHETDQLVLPHIALLSIAHVVSDESYFTRLGLNLLIRQTDSHPLVKMSPKEFMFGYESTLMTIGNKFLSSWITFDKLGLIDRMYDFDGDFETVYTGEGDVRKGGLIDTYRGSEKIPQWDSPCGNVRGASDGAKFPSHIEPNDTLKFFRKSLCRAKPLVRVNTTMSSGLKGYVYRFADNANDNGRYDPENKCFCKTEKCLPPGLLDVHECYYGFPIALSYPHFFQGDQILSDSVDGLEPDIRKHQSYFVIQPESGLPLDLAVRYQINMALGNIKSIANVEKFSNMIIPMLWTENRLYTLPEKMAARFQLYLNVGPLVENGIMHLFFVIGPLIILIGLYMFKKSKKTFQNQAPWIDEEMATMEQKLSTYIPKSRKSMTAKELEVYFSSLVAPLNQHLDCHEIGFQEFNFKDED